MGHSSPFLDAIGIVRRHPDDLVGFAVDAEKVSALAILHAGAIPSIADVAIGHALAASTEPPTPLVTVNLACVVAEQ